MFCKNCGKEIKEGQLFCDNCGTKVEGVETKVENSNESTNVNSTSTVSASASTNEKPVKNNNWIKVVITVLVLGVFIGLNSSNNSSNNTSNESLVDLPAWEIPELEPVKVKEVSLPEATEQYSKGDLEFKLPKTYHYSVDDSTEDTDVYSTTADDNEQFIISISVSETPFTLEELISYADEDTWSSEGSTIVKSEEMKKEYINGVTWYVKSVQYKSNDGTEDFIAEYYYAQSGNTVYIVTFAYDALNGKNLDTSNTTQFYNIKQSLKIN